MVVKMGQSAELTLDKTTPHESVGWSGHTNVRPTMQDEELVSLGHSEETLTLTATRNFCRANDLQVRCTGMLYIKE